MFSLHRQSLVAWLVVGTWIRSTAMLLLPVVTSLTSAYIPGFLPISASKGQKEWSPLLWATTRRRLHFHSEIGAYYEKSRTRMQWTTWLTE